jgi:hypothetical protein
VDEILDLSKRVLELEADLEQPKEDLRLTVKQGCKALGLRQDAFKSAHKLQKLEPIKLSAWLRTFDRTRKALNLDAQIDMDLEPKRRRKTGGRKKPAQDDGASATLQ